MATIRTFAEVEQRLAVAYLTIDPENTGLPQNVDSLDRYGWFKAQDKGTLTVFVFQYFPETLSISQDANYQSIEVPGGSHPIIQWVNNGPRTVNFQARFVQERGDPEAVNATADPRNKHNVNINAAVAYLRFMQYPHYNKQAAVLTSPPPRMLLTIEGTNLRSTARGKRAGLPVVLLNLNVEFAAWHPDGTPRVANVDLSFQETVQSARRGVRFVDRDDFRDTLFDYVRTYPPPHGAGAH